MDPEVSVWMDGLHGRFAGGCVLLTMDVRSLEVVFRLMEQLSFISGSQGDYQWPWNMDCKVIRDPSGRCNLNFAGNLTSEEIAEIISKANSFGLKVKSIAAGDRANANLLQADSLLKVGPSRFTLWAALIIAWLGWMFDGLEMGLYSWAIPPALKELLGTSESSAIGPSIGLTVALFLVGMSCGGLLFGRLGDRLGRVKTMIITVAVYAVFTGLSGLSQNFAQLALCRFLGALGLGGEWGLGVALVMETWPNTSRPLLAGLLGGAANVGFLCAGGTTMLLARYHLSWRWALVMGFFPAVLTLFIRLFVKESERWVQSRKRGEQSVLAELFSPALRRQSWIGIALAAVAVLGMWGVYQAWMQAWVEQLVGGGPHLQDARAAARAAVSTWMAVGSTVGAVLGGLAAEWLGRRRSYALYCIGAVTTSWLLYLTCDSYGPRLLTLAAIGGIFATAFFGWLPLYLPELFPTRIRATGDGLTFNAGRIISAGGVLVTGSLVKALGGHQYASSLMALIWVVGLILIWFGPETKGCNLPE